jgi:hypothetical protein
MNRLEFFEIHVSVDFQKRPVVHPGTLDGLFVQAEAQRLYQMQGRACSHTGTPDISRVSWYLRLMQYDVHFASSYPFPFFFRFRPF